MNYKELAASIPPEKKREYVRQSIEKAKNSPMTREYFRDKGMSAEEIKKIMEGYEALGWTI